ncbi:MAG: cytochrome c biogenesis protein ResB [Actinobacteria bacterium]|nr:cytochrome c biogenesis protein ResB [Actinomycetota bacterium]
MKTAIILLFTLAAASAIGSLIPQRPVNEFSVARWQINHAAWAGLAEHLGLFDVFGSAWFTAIYVLLLVSVLGCLVPRYIAFAKALRSRPKIDASLSQFRNYRYGMSRLESESALSGAARVLRRRRFRMVRGNGTIAAEKGHVREGGSLIFHTAFFVLIVGIFLARGFGFTGQSAIVEGRRFTDARVGYDSIKEGRFFNDRHRGFSIQLDRFDVDWYANGVPKDFNSHVSVIDHGRVVRTDSIRVNEPMNYRGINVYQLAWGWAPHIQVFQKGTLISDDYVIFLQDSGSQTWRGVVKVPSVTPAQLGLELYFFNDLDLAAGNVPFNASPYPRRPFVFYQEWRGDLGLSVPQSVYQLDKSALVKNKSGGLAIGGKQALDDGIEIRFPDLRKYSVLQMTANPGAWVLFAAAVLILVGLIPALYSSRRRIWVRAIPAGDVVRIEVAGHAWQRKAAFEEEFNALVRELGRDLKVEQPAASRVESGIDG